MQQPVSLTFDTPLTEAARLLLGVQATEILEQMRLVPSPDQAASVNAVHDLRVALRRSLTLLDALSPWFDRDWLRGQDRLLHNLLGSLGRVRDLDVLTELADDFFHSTEGTMLAGGPTLLIRLRQEQGAARQKLQCRLAEHAWTDRMARRTDRLSRADVTLRMMPQAITVKGSVRLYRIGEILPILLYQAASRLTVYHTVVRAGGPDDRTADRVVHQLRIAAKDFRYLVEHGQSLLGPAARQLIREFRAFQDSLGNWHDAVVACAALSKLESSACSSAGRGNAALLEQEKEAIRGWLLHQENQRENLFLTFLGQWQQMTPAWFHEHLSAALDSLYSVKPD